MKKVFFLFAVIFFSLHIFAQEFNCGLKFGLNYSQLAVDNLANNPQLRILGKTYTPKAGIDFGAFARLERQRFYIQPEVLYSVKNSSDNIRILIGGDASGSEIISFKLESVQFPLLFGYKLINLPSSSINMYTGPALNLSLNNSWANFSPIYAETLFFKKQVWEWQAGAAMDLGKFIFDLRYEMGISNACDVKKALLRFDSRFQTLTFTIAAKLL